MLEHIRSREERWGAIRYNTLTDEFTAEVARGQEPLPSAPIGIGWVIIGGCNLECVHCYGNLEQLPRVVLSTTECFTIVERIIEEKVMRVTISGGEPMLRDDLFAIIRKFYDNGISVMLGTNGTFIQQENVRNLHMCTRVEISLDGGTKDINNRIRPSRQKSGDAWSETMKALTLCVGNGINLRVLTALNAQNQHSLLAMAGILEYLGVTHWGISWTIPAGRAFPIYDQLRPLESVIIPQLEQIRQMHPGLHVRYSNRSVDYNRFYCLILPDGQIGTEDVTVGQKIYFGSLLHIPIAFVWNAGNYNLSQHFEKWVGNRVCYTQ